MHKKTAKIPVKNLSLNNKSLLVGGALLLVVVVGAVAFAAMNNPAKNTPQQTTQGTTETPEASDATPETTTPTTPAPQGQQPGATPSQPPTFAVTGITVHDPTPVNNIDKLGNSHAACQVKADIAVSAAGTVKYYWDTYHAEYFNPSNKGPEESVAFTQAGTKTVTLQTYVSNDNRRFTLVVVSPSGIAKATTTKVWCQK